MTIDPTLIDRVVAHFEDWESLSDEKFAGLMSGFELGASFAKEYPDLAEEFLNACRVDPSFSEAHRHKALMLVDDLVKEVWEGREHGTQ